MHFSIPSCHGDGVSINGCCQEKGKGSGPNLEIVCDEKTLLAHFRIFRWCGLLSKSY